MIREILNDGFRYIASRIAVALIMVVSIPIIIKLIGIETYGAYSQTLALATAISAFFYAWIYQSYLRYGTNGMSLETAMTLFAISTVLMLVMAIFSVLLASQSIAKAGMILFVASSIGFYQVFRVHLQAHRFISEFSLAEILRTIAIALIPICIFWSTNNLSDFEMLVVFALSNCLYALSIFCFISLKPNYSMKHPISVRLILRYGGPLAIWLCLAGGMNFLDRSLVIDIHGDASGGQFAAYVDLYNRIGATIIIPLSTAVIPAVLSKGGSSRAFSSNWYFLSLSGLCIIVSCISLTIIWILLNKLEINFFLIGDYTTTFCLLLGLSFWQISVLLNKHLELDGNTIQIIIIMISCLLIHYSVIFFWDRDSGVSIFSYAYAISGISYALMSFAAAKTSIYKRTTK